MKKTISVEEAAKILGIGRNTAYEAARSGELPTIRVGRRILVPYAAIERMLGIGVTEQEEREGTKEE